MAKFSKLQLSLLICLLCPLLAFSQTFDETKLVADDGAFGDALGNSVAIDGRRIVAGTPDDDDGGTNAGAAYIFEWDPITSDWDTTKLIASDISAIDDFGESVAISGDRIVIGSPADDDNGSTSGSIYIYDWNASTSTWDETKLTASDGDALDRFGFSVSVSGDRIAVGARGDEGETGAVYLLDWNATTSTWDETKLLASDADFGDFFGYSVALDGDRLVVGAHLNDDGSASSGSAYIFDWNATTSSWDETKLTASDAGLDWNFGFSVGTSNNRVVVGARGGELNGIGSGSAYIFERNPATSVWEETLLAPTDTANNDQFGYSVAIHGDRAVVGAQWDDLNGNNNGAAYTYDFNPTTSTWDVTRFTPQNPATSGVYGRSVAASADSFVVGAVNADGFATVTGAVYLYTQPCVPTSASITEVACDAYTWPLNNETYTTSGLYVDTIVNVGGCDSIVSLELTINSSDSVDIAETACEAYTWPANSQTYITNGQYVATLTNLAGCDSVVTLDLTINASSSSTLDTTIASGGTLSINGENFDATGTYTQTLTNAADCDSTLTINLTITTGLNELKALGISVYPNPTQGTLVLTADQPLGDIVVTSILGNTVLRQAASNQHQIELNLDALPAGVYLLQTAGQALRLVKE